jgi:hypothetical protein
MRETPNAPSANNDPKKRETIATDRCESDAAQRDNAGPLLCSAAQESPRLTSADSPSNEKTTGDDASVKPATATGDADVGVDNTPEEERTEAGVSSAVCSVARESPRSARGGDWYFCFTKEGAGGTEKKTGAEEETGAENKTVFSNIQSSSGWAVLPRRNKYTIKYTKFFLPSACFDVAVQISTSKNPSLVDTSSKRPFEAF